MTINMYQSICTDLMFSLIVSTVLGLVENILNAYTWIECIHICIDYTYVYSIYLYTYMVYISKNIFVPACISVSPL